MMNFDYLDSRTKPINSPSQVRDELLQLKDVAENIGSYLWSYRGDFTEAPDNEQHLGIVAQDLLKVPGLESAVVEDENGILKVDTQYVALAALGLVAALARVVLEDSKGVEDESSTELPNAVSNEETGEGTTDTATETTETEPVATPSPKTTNITELEQPETEPVTGDVGTEASGSVKDAN